MSLYIGIDIGIGVSSGASWTAVVALNHKSDRPVYAERYKAEFNNFEKRLGKLSEFCYSAILNAATEQLNTVKGVLIAEPKMRGITKEKTSRSGVVTKFQLNLRSMFEIAQARGAIVSRLENEGIKVYSLVESEIKKAFTGDGRADKPKIIRGAQIQWPNMPNDPDFGDATMVAEIFKRRYSKLRHDREFQH